MVTSRQLVACRPVEVTHVLAENGDAADKSVYNNNDFFCANILEDQAQWRDKTKGLSKHVIVKQCASRQWMDEDAMKVRKIGSIKGIRF